MLYTNINIKDETRIFKYVVGYDNADDRFAGEIEYILNETQKELLLFDGYSNLVRCGNYWVHEHTMSKEDLEITQYKTSELHLYFPSYSVETYNTDKEIKYALTISTWLYGYKVVLGSYIISRLDALACPPKKIFGDEYVEYIPINMINVHDFFYGDTWKDVRDILKTKSGSIKDATPCSMLNVDLFPVEEFENHYIVLDKYTGSQNAIQFSWGDKEEYLKFHIEPVKNHIEGKLIGPENLTTYLTNNCDFDNIGTISVDYMCVLKNDTDIYSTSNMIISNKKLLEEIYITDENFCKTVVGEEFTEEALWKWWDEYFNGPHKVDKPLIIRAIATIKGNGRPLMYLVSNDIPVTQELFGRLICNEEEINLDDIDMNIYNIRTVNKRSEQQSTTGNIVGTNSKANIIQPVFFKARDVDNLILHPEVIENICINLDSFKSKVKRFIIQIEGCCFNEIGRTSGGVVFKIVGNTLPKSKTQGVYYILNENSELVTNGNYKYVV